MDQGFPLSLFRNPSVDSLFDVLDESSASSWDSTYTGQTNTQGSNVYVHFPCNNRNYVSSVQALAENERLSHGEPLISVHFRRHYIIIRLKEAACDFNCEWITEVSPHWHKNTSTAVKADDFGFKAINAVSSHEMANLTLDTREISYILGLIHKNSLKYFEYDQFFSQCSLRTTALGQHITTVNITCRNFW